MADIQQSVFFAAKPARVYSAIATSDGHRAFTGAEAAISAEEGGPWSAYGGGINGRNLEVVPNERLVQSWRAADWAPGVYSVVAFRFAGEGTGTRVTLDHTGIPDPVAPHIDAGWHARYWEPLKKWLEG